MGQPSCSWYQLASSLTRHHNPWHTCIGLRQGFSSRYPTDTVHWADQQQNRERCNDSWREYSTTSVELSCPQALRLSCYRGSPPWAPVTTWETVIILGDYFISRCFPCKYTYVLIRKFHVRAMVTPTVQKLGTDATKNAYWDKPPCRKKAFRVCSQWKITGPPQIVRYTY